jgi:hypothetical protein
MPRLELCLFLVLCLVLPVFACGDDAGGTTGSTGSGTLVLETEFGGSLSLSGTISVPGTIPAGVALSFELTLRKTNGEISMESDEYPFGPKTDASGTLRYLATGLVAGVYEVGILFDVNGNGEFSTGDIGDYLGSITNVIMETVSRSNVNGTAVAITNDPWG